MQVGDGVVDLGAEEHDAVAEEAVEDIVLRITEAAGLGDLAEHRGIGRHGPRG